MVDLARDFSRGIELVCRCKFPDEYIAEGQLMCLTDNVMYQGRIISTNDRDSTDLLGDLKTWLSSEPVIVAQGEVLRVVKDSTNVRPGKTPSIEPMGQAETSGDNFSVSAVGGVIGVVCVLVLLAVVLVIVILVGLRKHR